MPTDQLTQVQDIISVLTRGGRLPKRFTVANYRVGKWDSHIFMEALLCMMLAGLIAGFDGDKADDDGHGHIQVWETGEGHILAA